MFVPTPFFLLVAAAFVGVIANYADIRSKAKKWVIGSIHGLLHLAILCLSTAIVSVAAYKLQMAPGGDIWYFLAIVFGLTASGFIGGIIWGLYLLGVSYVLGDHPNDAFSAMRLDSYRQFLRLKIDGDELTVHPIGIDQSPRRGDWRKNPGFKENDQNTPYFVPERDLGPHFIEEPFVIDARNVAPLKP